MCLIMFSPDGTLPPEEVWHDAQHDNPDGIGVMSERAIVKWTGSNGYRKAWKHVNKLSAAGVPFAVHFRWRTHGASTTAQCHPHQTELGSHVMHNGVLGPTSAYATQEDSDTALYVKWYLYGIQDWQAVRPLIESHIGSGNKFVVMDENKEFHIFNEWCGVYHNGIWYSNDYSFDQKFYDELEAQNTNWKPYGSKWSYGSGTNYGLGHTDEYADYKPVVAKSAKESAEAFLREQGAVTTLQKPRWNESSEAWQEYYQELFERGEIDEYELDNIMACHWESDDYIDRDDTEDYGEYSDRMVKDCYKRGAP